MVSCHCMCAEYSAHVKTHFISASFCLPHCRPHLFPLTNSVCHQLSLSLLHLTISWTCTTASATLCCSLACVRLGGLATRHSQVQHLRCYLCHVILLNLNVPHPIGSALPHHCRPIVLLPHHTRDLFGDIY